MQYSDFLLDMRKGLHSRDFVLELFDPSPLDCESSSDVFVSFGLYPQCRRMESVRANKGRGWVGHPGLGHMYLPILECDSICRLRSLQLWKRVVGVSQFK